ncbi:MAG: 16S rRNA methyltransferase [Candidatus Thermoplasmatota archaeon]
MRQFFFILADAELELIPPEILGERCIQNNARARGKAPEKILLDASHHHPAFGKLRDSDRRGRPDITHFFLMLCLDSDLSFEKRLRAFVHTRNDDVIAVNPETRLPPNYPRFVGLIETLYEKQVVPSAENALLELRHGVPLETLVAALKPDEIVVLDSTGEKTDVLPRRMAELEGERVVVIIGGFSKGCFRTDLKKLKPAPRCYSLGERMMKVWTVTAKVLCSIDMSERMAVPAEAPGPADAPKPKKVRAPSKPRPARKKKAE